VVEVLAELRRSCQVSRVLVEANAVQSALPNVGRVAESAID